MNTSQGFTKGPYIQVIATSLSRSTDFEDNNATTLKRARSSGIFYAKTFDEIKLKDSNSNHVACVSVTLDNSILNYDSKLFQTDDFEPHLIGKFNIDNVNDFLKAIWGPNFEQLISFDDKTDRIKLILGSGNILKMSDYCAQVLGFEQTSFSGPYEDFAKFPVDLYKKYRPLIISCSLAESSFVSDTISNAIAILDTTADLLPHSNHRRTIGFNFSNLNWVRMVERPGVYIKLRVTNADNEIVSFSPQAEITIVLKIHTYPYELI